MNQEQNYWTLNFNLGDEISFTQATLDARYRQAGLQDLAKENGPYHQYKVVDFTDNDRSSPYSRIGVRKDGFQGQVPLYYVRCGDVIGRELRPTGQTVMKQGGKGNIAIPQPRYSVREVRAGFEIVDSTGQEQPYLIERLNSDGVDISESKQAIAEKWAYTWNIVELGYCGACEHKFEEGEQRYPAVGFHCLDKVVCFHCACSQED